jgi:endoglucanase
VYLSELSALRGVSGNEAAVRTYISEQIRGLVDEMWVDPMGNLFARKGTHLSGPHVMLAAHMDEVGLLVTHIEDDGLLRFDTVGGIDHRVLPSVWVQVGDEAVPGVIGAKAIHLKKPEERGKPVARDDLFIDIGARSKAEAEKLVQPGDYATFWTDYEELGDRRAKGKAFDDRVGCHVLMELLKDEVQTPLTAVFTVQEEIGLRGAQVAAYTVQPDVALVLEGTTCADIPLSIPHGESTKLGHGPAITVADRSTVVHPRMVELLIEAGERAGVPYQLKRTTFGGTDAGTIHRAGAGVRTGIVSVPCRYIHTPAAMLSLDDVENTVRLVRAFLDSIPAGGSL